jgi:4-diphosphocytidyl-2C-methyl-D-erythritol kinase
MKAGAVAAMMSGSGPTTFGLFPTGKFTSEEIQLVVEQFSLVYGHRVYATRTYAGA